MSYSSFEELKILKFSGSFHCSVIKFLNCRLTRQLVYITIIKVSCQQLFLIIFNIFCQASVCLAPTNEIVPLWAVVVNNFFDIFLTIFLTPELCHFTVNLSSLYVRTMLLISVTLSSGTMNTNMPFCVSPALIVTSLRLVISLNIRLA